MFSIKKLHALKCSNAESDGQAAKEKRMKELGEEIKEAEVEISSLPEKSRLDIIKKREKMNDVVLLKVELKETAKQGEFLTTYLLESIPYINKVKELEKQLESDPKNGDLKKRRGEIVSEYVKKFFPSFKSRFHNEDHDAQQNFVSTCCSAALIQTQSSSVVCSNCGLVAILNEQNLAAPSKNLSYTRSISTSKAYSYRRLNHLREFIRQITGRTAMSLPSEKISLVKKELKKRTLPLSFVDAECVRKVLKKLKLSSYYEQSSALAKYLNPSLDLPDISPEYEEKLAIQFICLEKPFEQIRDEIDSNRKNFLSYSFILYRLNQLNNREDLNNKLKLLKSVRLLNKQNLFWKAITKKLGWKYWGDVLL